MDGINSGYQPKKRLLPPSIHTDERSQALLYLIWGLTQFQVNRLNVYNIDTVDASVLPHLIQQFRLEKFLPVDLPVDRQRKLIKRAIEIWRYLGTIYGMQAVIDAVLGISVNVAEWPSYQGVPHTFTVAFPIDQTSYYGNFGTSFQAALRQLIEASKPARSHLLRLDLALDSNAELRMGATARDKIIVLNANCYKAEDRNLNLVVGTVARNFILVKT